jgi:hypothetical protein
MQFLQQVGTDSYPFSLPTSELLFRLTKLKELFSLYGPAQCTLQRHNTENSKQIFPERNCAASVPIPTFMFCEGFIDSHDWSAYSAAGK